MKRLGLMFAAVMLAVGMMGCSDGSSDPRPGLWQGTNMTFYVSSDSGKLTAQGSPLRTWDGRPASLVAGSTQLGVRLYNTYDVPIVDGKFSMGSVVTGSFDSSKKASGNFTLRSGSINVNTDWTANATD